MHYAQRHFKAITYLQVGDEVWSHSILPLDLSTTFVALSLCHQIVHNNVPVQVENQCLALSLGGLKSEILTKRSERCTAAIRNLLRLCDVWERSVPGEPKSGEFWRRNGNKEADSPDINRLCSIVDLFTCTCFFAHLYMCMVHTCPDSMHV